MTDKPDERAAVVADREAFANWLLWDDGDHCLNEELCDALSAERRRQRKTGIYCAHPIFKLFAEALIRGDHTERTDDA